MMAKKIFLFFLIIDSFILNSQTNNQITVLDSLFLYKRITNKYFLTQTNNNIDKLSDKEFCYYILSSLDSMPRDTILRQINKRSDQKKGCFYYTVVGYLDYQKYQYDESIKALKTSLNIDTENKDYLDYIFLGYNYNEQYKYDSAVEAFYAGFKKFPNNPEVQFNYANFLMKRNQLDSSMIVLNKISEKYCPSEILRLKGDIFFRKNNYSNSMLNYRESIAIDSVNIDSKIGICKCLQQTGKLDSALYYFSILNNEYNDLEVKYFYSLALIQKKIFDDAETLLENLVITNPIPLFCEKLTYSIFIDQNRIEDGIDFYGNAIYKVASGEDKCILYCHLMFLENPNSIDIASNIFFIKENMDKYSIDCLGTFGYFQSLFSMQRQ